MQEFCCLCHSYHDSQLCSEIYHDGDYRFAGLDCQKDYAAQQNVAEATSRSCHVKADYIPPIPPVKSCPKCGSVSIKPVAYLDAQEWILSGWECENNCGEIEGSTVFEWPFGPNDYATPEDLEKLGFFIV